MEVSDITKLIVAVGLTGCGIGISIQIMRLLGAFTDNVKDLRKTVKNVGILTDELVKDQRMIREGIGYFVSAARKVGSLVETVSEKIIAPISLISGFLSSVGGFIENVSSRFKKQS